MEADGEYIGGYRLIRLLGSGGMGEVYLVEHPRLPRRDVLKLLNPTVSRDERFRSRFNRESDLLARLRHPNIITVYDRGECDGRLWLAMEYIEGDDAAQLLRSRGALPLDIAIEIIAGTSAALDYAYAVHRITHRDVKPANILLGFGSDGRLATVKLADFGIAKAVGESTSLTSTGVTIGTMTYISPEAIEGREIDNRADIYSLGATAFELLSGSPPFAADTLPALMMAHVSQPVPSITQRNPYLPPHFDSVFARVLAKDPAARYASCAEFLDGLRASFGDDKRSLSHLPTRVPAPTSQGLAHRPRRLSIVQHQSWQVNPYHPHQAIAGKQFSMRHGSWLRRTMIAIGAVASTIAVMVAAVILLDEPRDQRRQEGSEPNATERASSPVVFDRLLLGPTEVGKIMGHDDMVVTDRGDHELSEDQVEPLNVTPARCTYVGVIDRGTLVSDDIRQLRYSFTVAPSDGYNSKVFQEAVEVVSENRAREIFDDQAAAWQRCVNRDLTSVETGGETIVFSDLVVDADIVSVISSSQDAPQGFICRAVLARKYSYLVNASICDYGTTDRVTNIVDQILSKVTSPAKGKIAAPAPVIDRRYLYAPQVSSLVGHQVATTSLRSGLLTPSGPKGAITPANCTSLAMGADAATYADIAWNVAFTAVMKRAEPVPENPLYVVQSIVMAPSAAVASRFLNTASLAWKGCLKQVLRLGNDEIRGFDVVEVDTSAPNMIVARSTQTTTPSFQHLHAMAVQGPYIVEVLVRGEADPDMRTFTEKLLALLD